ncbi:MAG: GAF domain-containing protein [Anaerolineae bacterium]|nr:GAF domain-containing protein [Anaerolineae bacterium]
MTANPQPWYGHLMESVQRALSVPTKDEELRRLGMLFNVMMLMSICFSLLFFATYFLAWREGLITRLLDLWLQGVFALSYVPLAIVALALTKRGRVRFAFSLYIWGCYLTTSLAIYLFGGGYSPIWLLYFWPMSLASTFLPAFTLVVMVVGLLLYFAMIFLFAGLGHYTPLVPQSAMLFWFTAQSLTLMLLTAIPGIVSYLNAHSVQTVFHRLQNTALTLDETRRELEERVNARTAVLQKRAEQFRAIAEVGRVIASIPEVQRLLETAVRLIADRLHFYHVAIFLIDPSGEWAVLQAASSEGGGRLLARGYRLHVGDAGVIGYVSRTGLARFVFDVGEDAVWFNNPDLPETRSEIGLPLMARDQLVGVLDIQTEAVAAFTDEDVTVFRILADSIAVSISNTRSLAETQETLERLSRYQEQDALRAWRHALARRDMQVDYAYASGLVSRIDVDEIALPVEPQSITDVTTVETASGQHLLLAPISIRRQRLGVLSFEKPTPWTDEQLQLTRFVVEQLELALDNARLLEETTLRANQQRARSEITARVRLGGSTDAIMRGAVTELGRALQVDRSRIQLLAFGEENEGQKSSS